LCVINALAGPQQGPGLPQRRCKRPNAGRHLFWLGGLERIVLCGDGGVYARHLQ
jgi:hypothetical protein